MRETIRLNPQTINLNTGLEMMLLFAGQTDDAEAQMRIPLEINPADANAHFQLAYVHWTRGNTELAMSETEEFYLRANPKSGFEGQAIEAYRRAGGGKPGLDAYARFYLELLDKNEKSRKPDEWTGPMNWVWFYMFLNDLDKAFEFYERALEERQLWAVQAIINPAFKPLWADPRFDEILKRTGLDKYFPERLHSSSAAKNSQ